ncbi:MAG: hypothetical protein AABY88_02855, partial [Pseudomonadota bacterium]
MKFHPAAPDPSVSLRLPQLAGWLAPDNPASGARSGEDLCRRTPMPYWLAAPGERRTTSFIKR